MEFRSTFRDWCAEQTDYPNEVAEMALAHTVGNKVEAAYRRGDLLCQEAAAHAGLGGLRPRSPRGKYDRRS